MRRGNKSGNREADMYTLKEISSCCSEEISKIEKACFGSEAWSEEVIKTSIESDNYVFIACCENSQIVGYVNASVILDEAELNRLAVFGTHRGKGIGKLLVDTLLDYLKGQNITLVRLEVRASNHPAISLYNSKKFKQYAVRKNYYSNPEEDAVLMSLTI